MDWLDFIEIFAGNEHQNHTFLMSKLIIIFLIYMVTIIWTSLKNVNDKSINGGENKDNQFSKLGTLFLTIFLWFFSIIFFSFNLTYYLNNKEIGIVFFGVLTLFNFIWMIIAWGTLLINIKKSSMSIDEKKSFYLDNNRTWNAGLTGLMFGLVGLFMFTVAWSDKSSPAPTQNFEFHPVALLIFIVTIIIPVYLLIKVPKWMRKYAESLM